MASKIKRRRRSQKHYEIHTLYNVKLTLFTHTGNKSHRITYICIYIQKSVINLHVMDLKLIQSIIKNIGGITLIITTV